MIFRKLLLGGFGILMSYMSQVQTILLFQGCDKIVLRLHTAGTESPGTPKHISREQEMPTDNNRQQQTSKPWNKRIV